MLPLDKEIQLVKLDLEDFKITTSRILIHLSNVITDKKEKNGYYICSSEIAGTKKFIRPLNVSLFIFDLNEFEYSFTAFRTILNRIKDQEIDFNITDKNIIDKTIYTIQQSFGAGMDLMVNPNSARKHIGNRFEELMKLVFTEIGIANKKIVLQIPYATEDGEKIYKCENDIVLSPYKIVRSTSKSLDIHEVVVSAKTTSKDRMVKMFIDKILLEKFVNHPQKVIGIFLNDVQRKESENISYTLVSGLFMVYTQLLTELEGIYYLDLPPIAKKIPYSKYIKSFSELITSDLQILFNS